MISSSITVNLQMKLKRFLFNTTLSYRQYFSVCHLKLPQKKKKGHSYTVLKGQYTPDIFCL